MDIINPDTFYQLWKQRIMQINSPWKSVKNSLPTGGGDYFILAFGYPLVAEFFNISKTWDIDGNPKVSTEDVTHWMEIPEVPEGLKVTDTLDAIAREAHFRIVQSVECIEEGRSDEALLHANMALVSIGRTITALSNQGEGAVAWIEPGTLNACSAAEFEEVRRAYPGIYANWFPVYLHPAEADRRDAERLDWLAFHGAAMRNDDGMEGGGWFVLAPYHTGIASVDGRTRFKTVREAIDAATQEQT